MKALSGLTPALSRRLQQQLLAQLPPAAARTLRRTLSLHNTAPPRDRYYTRSHSATKSTNTDSNSNTVEEKPNDSPDKIISSRNSPTVEVNKSEDKQKNNEFESLASKPRKLEETEYLVKDSTETSQFCTLPRIKRDPSISRESTPILSTAHDMGYDYSAKLGSLSKDLSHSRGNSIHGSPDRPLLSKYLTPERNISLDESYSSDSCSILSEPSYIAAYGSPSVGSTFRRHSMRLANDRDVPRKRISRFLRPDFFETAPDESLYAKHKKEKELETQKILREIREKKNKIESSAITNPTEIESTRQLLNKDEDLYLRKSLSPISIMAGKERSRSITPFYPILDNIKETTLDTSSKISDSYKTREGNDFPKQNNDDLSNKESKLMRPKSYPAKTLEKDNDLQSSNILPKSTVTNDSEQEQNVRKESKLIRPKSYPSGSSSPDKVCVNRNIKKDESNSKTLKDEPPNPEITNDVEVSFSISLPKKTKLSTATKTNLLTNTEPFERKNDPNPIKSPSTDDSLTLKKYQVLNIEKEISQPKLESNNCEEKINFTTAAESANNESKISKVTNHTLEKVEIPKMQNDVLSEPDSIEKKATVKKRIIKKVSSKSKTDTEFKPEDSEVKNDVDKKRITKKVKEKSSDDCTKINTVPKKKSVFQSIGHKLEKLASSKSNSPEKISESISRPCQAKNDKLKRNQREQSVPISGSVNTTESSFIKRAVTLTDVVGLDITQPTTNTNKTAVSKVLGLFKKFDTKDKARNAHEKADHDLKSEAPATLPECVTEDLDQDKPKRPTSLLLNGVSKKHVYARTASDNVSLDTAKSDDTLLRKKDSDDKSLRNSLKLDFSRLPRVKKIVPANPVIEPQLMNVSLDKISEKSKPDKISSILDNSNVIDEISRSRSRSRSTFSNSDVRSDQSSDKITDKISFDNGHHPTRNHESTTPEKEDIIDRIRRKSFYSRFNEKKQRRKSSLVGPGATEYDPIARIHSQPMIDRDSKYNTPPNSPGNYDLSPGSIASDLSPATERYRSLLTDLPSSTRTSLRYEPSNYAINDKIDTYRSLDRSDFRKYPGTKSYLDCDQPSSHESQRYGRTKLLLDNDTDDRRLLGQPKDQYKYNRTISMYSPGNFATYRPKRIRNSAIIMKESEKEPSPENILDKIRQRKKLSISVTRKPDSEKECLPRPNNSSKGESDGTECFEKTD